VRPGSRRRPAVVAPVAALTPISPQTATTHDTRQVSGLAAFLVLTLLPQLPLVVWICFMSLPDGAYPLDVAVGILQAGLLLAEAREAWAAIRVLIGKQTADFIQVLQLEGEARRAAEAAAAASREEAAAAAARRRRGGGSRGSALSVRSQSPSSLAGGAGGDRGPSPLHPPLSFSHVMGPAARSGGGGAGVPLLPPRPGRGGGLAEDAAARVRVSDVAGLGIAGLRSALGGGGGAASAITTTRRLAREMGVAAETPRVRDE
jgi:hypothetical protein